MKSALFLRETGLKAGFFMRLFLGGVAIATTSQAATLSPGSAQIRYTGRFDFTSPEQPRFDWPACVIEAAFTGTSVTVLLSGGENNFNVYVDGQRKPNIVLSNGVNSYAVAGPFAAGNHVLRLTKRTEGNSGIVTFGGLQVDDNQGTASLPPRLNHRVLFIGDSYTAGYGTEANTQSCGSSKRQYDNADTAFGALTARAVGAEYSIQAVSGIGMIHNYGDASPQSTAPFPTYFDRTLFNQAGLKFAYSSWVPEVIVIALGNNDFSTSVKPSQEQYSTAYKSFHATVRAAYPQAHLVCVAFGDDRLQTSYIPAIVQSLTSQGDGKIHYFQMPSLGNNATACDYHPNLAGQKKYAEALVPEVSKWLNDGVAIQVQAQKKRPNVDSYRYLNEKSRAWLLGRRLEMQLTPQVIQFRFN